MYRSAKLAALALFVIDANACQRERHFHHDGKNLKRQVSERLPLSDAEALITSSFDNRSISDWSYYYVRSPRGDLDEKLMELADTWRPHRRKKQVSSTM